MTSDTFKQRRGKIALDPVGQYPATLDAHGFGHSQGQLVAAGGGHVGQGNAGVAEGRLDDLDAGLEDTALSASQIILAPRRHLTE